MRRRSALLLLFLALDPACGWAVQIHPAAPPGFSRAFAPLSRWLGTPAGIAAIEADPPLRQFLRIDPETTPGRAALAPLVETIPRAVLAELSSIEALDGSRRGAALAALAEARRQAAPDVERRISAAVSDVRADPESLSPEEMISLESEAGRLALFSPAGRAGEKTVRRLRSERAMREAGRTAERLRLDWDSDDFSPAAQDVVDGGGTPSQGKISLSLSPSAAPSSYYDAGHWRPSLVPDASYGRRLNAAAALLGGGDEDGPAVTRARRALTDTVRELDPKIYSHMMRVGLLAGLIAYRMGHTLEYSRRVAWGARVHDIGKREEPIRTVVNKEGRLDAAERAIMERHPEVGSAIISLDRSLDPASRRVGMRVALNHHETLDGAGYPRRLKGDAIPLESRITSIADFYDAMMEHRPYRAGMSSAEAVAIMSKTVHKFDPTAWKAFLTIVSPGTAGGLTKQ